MSSSFTNRASFGLAPDKFKKEKILRTTLASVEKQLNIPEIVRCHRSYLINSGSDYLYQKLNNHTSLKHREMKISIPISRSKEKEIKELLSDK